MSTIDNEDIRGEAARFLHLMEAPHALNPSEREELRGFPDWVADARNAQEFHELTMISAMASGLSPDDVARWQAQDNTVAAERVRSRSQIVRWAMAASVVLVIMVTGGVFMRDQHWIGNEAYVTHTGENRTVTFQDGSVAHLNTRTEVRWIGSADDRRLELIEGEALFDVVHDDTRPFRITLDNSEIRVLGTRFNVYRKPNGDTTVTVLEGTVEVRGSAKGGWVRTLNSGEQIAYRKLGLISEPHPMQAQNAITWRDGKIRFVDEPVERVLEELTRYTDQEIVVRDPRVNEKRFNGTLSTKDVRAAVRRLQEYSPQIEVKENNNTLTLDYRATEPVRGKD